MFIPSLGDDPSDFERFFYLRLELEKYPPEALLQLDFSRCTKFRQNASAMLVGLIYLLVVEERREVAVLWDTIRPGMRANLQRNGFEPLLHDGVAKVRPGNNTPLRLDTRKDSVGIPRYLDAQVLGRGWLNLSDPLKQQIVGRLWELYENAFEHGRAPVVTCGQFDPRRQELRLTIVDVGDGIAAQVRRHLGLPGLPAEACLRKAFERGYSTASNPFSRGLGLDILREFIMVNDGKMDIYSDQAVATVAGTRESFRSTRCSFRGTVVNIVLKCDGLRYVLVSELELPGGQLLF